MYENVTHIDYVSERYFRIPVAKIFAQFARGFADNLQLSYNRIYHHFVGDKLLITYAAEVLLYRFDGVVYMTEI